jgi:hypothetical protein
VEEIQAVEPQVVEEIQAVEPQVVEEIQAVVVECSFCQGFFSLHAC